MQLATLKTEVRCKCDDANFARIVPNSSSHLTLQNTLRPA